MNSTLADWPSTDTPRRAGVTALGIGGTNAHVILEEAPRASHATSTRTHFLIPLSAKTETALSEIASRLEAHLHEQPTLRLADLAFTCQVRRKEFPHRGVVMARDTA